MKQWSNGGGNVRQFKGYYTEQSVIEHLIPVLDLASKIALPKTLSLNQELTLDPKDIKEIKADHRFDEEARSFRVRDRKGRFPAEAAERCLGSANDHSSRRLRPRRRPRPQLRELNRRRLLRKRSKAFR